MNDMPVACQNPNVTEPQRDLSPAVSNPFYNTSSYGIKKRATGGSPFIKSVLFFVAVAVAAAFTFFIFAFIVDAGEFFAASGADNVCKIYCRG